MSEIEPIDLDYDLFTIESIPPTTRYIKLVRKINEIIKQVNGEDNEE